jgi:predicted Zn-ribbon and HTH transcriptional regulator
MKYRCPECKSTNVYQECSVIAKMKMNGGKIYDVNKANTDNIFCENGYCDKCGYVGNIEEFNP